MEFIKTSIRIFLRHRNVVNRQIMNKVHNTKITEESLPKERHYNKSIQNNPNKVDTLLNIKQTLSSLFETINPSEDLFLNIRNDIINKHLIPEKSVDLKILEACIMYDKFETAKFYFEYLKSKNYPMNNFILIKYLQVINARKIPISNDIQEDIINICNKIQKDYECLPTPILMTCVHALCLTSKWKTAIDLIKVNGTMEDITCATLSCIVLAAFKNGTPKIGFEFLEEIETNKDYVHGRKTIYNIYLNYYLQNKQEKLNDAIHKMFHFWKKLDVIPVKSVIDIFVDVCIKSGWEGHYVKISTDGQCSHCQNYLPSITLKNNFSKLSEAIISNIIIGEDIFQRTSPLEFKKFKSFIRKFQPFDIVVDGLNVALNKAQMMEHIVDKFTAEGKKVLIITRKHQYKVSKWMFNRDNVYVYFLQDITQDDPFILYATLASGNNSKFISIDQMRQHHHKLKKFNLHKDFIRWQFSHQYTWYYNNVTKMSTLIEPISYDSFMHNQNGHWHIPYNDSLKQRHTPSKTWVCLRCPKK
ncbi:PREDICTED: mitochondrial ribonuclease P protein 3 [Polistes dominula]|uniref:ribonuclease P n=1 Tax=Polistes dominula TaxID=743375 RepID=A0ABM1IRC1_POLDO|nr:PREDICTED: mitochondrial ribonuclease P protein 3 [Polistes dominula]